MKATVTDIVDAMHEGDLEKLTAASLGRIWQHVQDLTTQSFAMLTPWQAARSVPENKALLQRFKRELRGQGFGFVQLIGHWKDQQEPSFFVPGMDLATAHRIGNAYNQDAVIYGGPDSGAKVVLVDSSGHQQVLADHFTAEALGDAFSELAGKRGRKFTFVTSTAASQMEFLTATVYERSRYEKRLYEELTAI